MDEDQPELFSHRGLRVPKDLMIKKEKIVSERRDMSARGAHRASDTMIIGSVTLI